MVAERLPDRLADLLLAEEAEFQGVVFAAGADVVDEQVVLGDLVPLFGVVPVPPGVGDQEAVPVDQGVVDRDHPLVAVAGGGVLLEQFQPPPVEGLAIPHGLGKEAVEAGLVGGLGELVMDAQDGLPLGDEEPGQVLGEVAALALVSEEITVLSQGVLDDPGELDDPWHDQMLRSPTAPERMRAKRADFAYFDAAARQIAKPQYRLRCGFFSGGAPRVDRWRAFSRSVWTRSFRISRRWKTHALPSICSTPWSVWSSS